MIAILSPAKTLDFESPPPATRHTMPRFLHHSAEIMGVLQGYITEELGRLMKLKRNLAELNSERNSRWAADLHGDPGEARHAIFAFRGEVYRGLDADTLDDEDLAFAQDHLRILSGLYGVLRPLDAILPYRLEMGTPLKTDRGDNLYQFWGTTLAEDLSSSTDTVINLASQEYFKALSTQSLAAQALSTQPLSVPVITPVFREQTARGPRVIAVYAKRQRGRMARYIVDRRITSPEALREYDLDGYSFDQASSTEREWVFLR